jgi:hypothetical protein
MSARLLAITLILLASHLLRAQLKSVIYDFDGFDLGQTNLPEGDYSYGDLHYKIVRPPIGQGSGMIGDRCLELNVIWNLNYAAFGRGISKFIPLEQGRDVFNFYFLNTSGQNALIELVLADDDNQSNAYEAAADDSWRTSVSISSGGQWQLISVPLSQFTDANPGGNSKMDFGFSAQEGMLLLCEFKFAKPVSTGASALFYIDLICFSEGNLTTGSAITDLPSATSADYCRTGAFMPTNGPSFLAIPQQIESFFSPAKKITYVNTYLQWSQNNQLFANALPGNALQELLNAGYQPILTWEPHYLSLNPLDAQQPTLQQILNGNFDAYLDQFGDALLRYSDTIIVRLMHEFDGDWYSWCISQNGQDPQRFANAFRHIVDRVRSRGAVKVKWMWCPNSDSAPYQSYNWLLNAYPGDTYVDYTGTDIYNGHYPAALPWWRSFRWVAAESCYYLKKYFPNKPLIICELGCRERVGNDDATSQTKAEWFKEMDRQLQSHFHQVRGLVFFNTSTGTVQNWQINSGPASIAMLQNEIWEDPYYFPESSLVTLGELNKKKPILFFPNPVTEHLHLQVTQLKSWKISDSNGKSLREGSALTVDLHDFSPGFYVITLIGDDFMKSFPLLMGQ